MKENEKINKVIQTQIILISPLGKTVVPMQIAYNDDEDAIDPVSEISLVYNDIKYQGNGTNYLWVDTFVDLQRKLPDDVKIACCMTCQHGNMCPYGNATNELYCTKDLLIKNKVDMCNLFDSTDAYSKRKIFSCDYCDDFVYQSDDYYTYNDYLLLLNEEK